MKKRFVVMLLTLGALCVGLTGCGNADSSSTVPPPETTTAEEQSVTTTTTTTTSQTEQTELTTSSEVTSSTSVSDVTEISVPSSEVETTTTTTTTTAETTEPKVTTTTTKPKTTTTKVTTTTKPKTTTTTTTTTKKVDDSKYEITGILACYNRLRLGESTAEDRQRIVDDMCQYAIDNFDGRSGVIEFERECTSKEACEYLRNLWGFGYEQSQKTEEVTVPINIEIVDTFTFDNNAHLNIACDTQGHQPLFRDETAEEAYYEALYFQGGCYATVNSGIRSFIRNLKWNDWGEGETMQIYFCIENDAIGDKAVDWWTVWFLTP